MDMLIWAYKKQNGKYIHLGLFQWSVIYGGWILCDYIGDCINGGLFQGVMEDESKEYYFNGG